MISDFAKKSGACLILIALFGCSMPSGPATAKGSKFNVGDEVYMKLDGKRGIVVSTKMKEEWISNTQGTTRVLYTIRIESAGSSTGYEEMQVYEEELTEQKPGGKST